MKSNGKEIPIRRIAAIASLGLAGFLGVAACSSAPATTSTTTQAADPQPPASSPQAAPASSPQAAPASSPQATPAEQTSASPQQVAQWVAEIAVGNESLPPLRGGEGQATFADCDPSTVSNPPSASTPASVLCNILYSNGSVWHQTVTVTMDSQANPVADSTDEGIELLQPASSDPQLSSPEYNPTYENFLPAWDQAQNEMDGAIDSQGPGITNSGDNDAGTGGDYDGSGD